MNVAETDSRLVALARAGDARAFEVLVRRHLRSAHAVALGVLGHPADAEDVCQDAFLTALEKLDDCRDPNRFAAWLMRIVRNRALNFHESRALRQGEPLEVEATAAEAEAVDDPAGAPSSWSCAAGSSPPSPACRPGSARWCCCTTSKGGSTGRSPISWARPKGP